jgi:L-lactate utilization protein LutB
VAYITEALSREGTVYATYCSLCNQQRDNRPSKIPVATAVNQQHINAMVNKTDDIREELLAAKRRTERDAKREAERIRHARASARAEEKNLEEAQRKGEMGEWYVCRLDLER